MARKTSPTLTDAELRLMRVLWERGPSTVNDVVDVLPAGESVAYSTVLTTMRILEQKGYVRHDQEGRAFVYEALVEPREAGRSAIRFILDRFFDNSPELLLANILADENIDMEDLEEIRKLVGEADTDDQGAENQNTRNEG